MRTRPWHSKSIWSRASYHRVGFSPRLVHVEFMVYEVAVEKTFLQVLQSSPANHYYINTQHTPITNLIPVGWYKRPVSVSSTTWLSQPTATMKGKETVVVDFIILFRHSFTHQCPRKDVIPWTTKARPDSRLPAFMVKAITAAYKFKSKDKGHRI